MPATSIQGTLYSDVIESGGGKERGDDQVHHNVGSLPDDLQFELVEPLRALFKDEVRAVEAELGMPEQLVWRQPFPRPWPGHTRGRQRGDKQRLDTLRDADAILQDEIRKAGSTASCGSPSVLPDIRTVGVRATSAPTATSSSSALLDLRRRDDSRLGRLPYDLLERIASRMINEIREVNRVTLDIRIEAPGTIEWE